MTTTETRNGYVEHLTKTLQLTLDAELELAKAKHHLEKPHKARLAPPERRAAQLEDALRRSLTSISAARNPVAAGK